MPSEPANKLESLHGRRGRRDGQKAFKQRFHSPAYVEAVTAPKPQALVKIVSQARGYRAKAVMEYISRTANQPEHAADPGLNQDGEKGLQFEDANGQTCQGQAAIDKKYEAWKKTLNVPRQAASGHPGTSRT